MRSDDFRRMWATHDVTQYRNGTQYFHHELVGDLELSYESFDLAGDIAQTLIVYTAERRLPIASSARPARAWSHPTDGGVMANRRVWMITGASRGMGVAFSKAALAAGDAVVATGRRPDEVATVLGESDSLHAVRARRHQCRRSPGGRGRGGGAVRPDRRARQQRRRVVQGLLRRDVARTGRAATGDEPARPDERHSAVLPVMRAQRSGHLVAISSGAGLVGFEYSSVYAASKSGLEGWMGALDQEVAPFGIRTTIINPGFFRTTLASPESLIWPAMTIDDYAERSAAQRTWWAAQDGQQAGDPDKLAQALLTILDEDPPPRRFIAGADVIALAQRKIDELHEQIESHRKLSTSLTFSPDDDAVD